MEKKALPVGIESFEEIRKDNYYYVDKTGMIRDLLRRRGKVNLFTRPRRFGKSLNMSMLKTFFETGCEKELFDGLEISKEEGLCSQYMGKYPVISLSLKGVNGSDYATARSLLCSAVGNEALRFQFLLEDDSLTEPEKQLYMQIIRVDPSGAGRFLMSDSVLMESLKTLSALLEKHFGQKVIVLIDEYDVPLSKADEQGYYEEMTLLIRNMFEQVLKTNDSLFFAVLTGCLRVARESIFTGLNNFKILSVTTVRFDEYFGFLDREVQEMLQYYGLEDKYAAVRDWYDGYRFGGVDVYCPWDVISYCDELTDDPDIQPKDYWSNTSGNYIIQHFIEKMDDGLAKGELEELISGGTVTKEIHEELTYNRLYESMDHIWSILLMTGYLTYREKKDGNDYCLAIPNMEIRNIFVNQIMAMFKSDIAGDGERVGAFCDALESGNAAEIEKLLAEYLNKTVSVRDTFARKPVKENFYHGLLLGILGYKNSWYVKSNKEAGDGYSDIFIRTEEKNTGMILEVKYAEAAQLDAACRMALKQIDDREYARALREDGCRTIYKYGIACCRKWCRVLMEREE